MALHIQMSEEAVRKLRQEALINRLVSFGVCAGMLLAFAAILYATVLMIKSEVAAEFLAYTAPQEDGPPTDKPVSKELTSKSSVPSPTVQPSVIVAMNAESPVAAPVSIDTTGDFDFDNLDVSMGLDAGLGDGLGEGGSGLGGAAGGSALEGTFYDLKLTRSGSPSKLAQVQTKDKDGKPLVDDQGKPMKRIRLADPGGHGVGEVLGRFFNGGWNQGVLSPYYSPKKKLYASSFYLPKAKAEYAPKAYDCADVCQDSGWIAVYRGKVRAPKTGKFRFIGTGDDMLAVRFDKKMVLEAGYRAPSLFNKENIVRWWISGDRRTRHWEEVKAGKVKGFEGFELISHIKEVKTWNSELGGLTAGKVFEVKEGHDYPIEVAISEIPGGAFGFVLLIEDVTEGKTPPGGKYDLFHTNFNFPDKKEIFEMIKSEKCLMGANNPDALEAPPYNEDSPIWTAVP